MTGFRIWTWFWITAAENVLMHLFSSPLYWLGLGNGVLILALIMWRLCHVENRWLHNAWLNGERQEETTSLFIRTLIGEIEKGHVCYAVMEKAFYKAHDEVVRCREWSHILACTADELQGCYGVMHKAYLLAHDAYVDLCSWRTKEYLAAVEGQANYKAMYENAERRIYEHQAKEALLRDELEQLQLFIVDRAAS